MKIDEIMVWEAFRGVAKYGNFSKAARALSIPVPQISKRVAKLEDRLGIRLFQRSTRVVSLTDDGKALLPRIETILDDLMGIENSFESQKQLSGTVRVTCVPFIAHQLLIPSIGAFKKMHPNIQVDLDLSEGVLNLIESNIDLAIRIQDEPEESDFVYRKLAPNDLILCASPNYLKRNTKPIKKPADLHGHNILMLAVHRKCKFQKDGSKLQDFEQSKWISCENGAFLTDLALNDFGILVRSVWDVRKHLREGKLVPILKNYPLETFGNIYVTIPSRRYLAPRVRTFMEFIIKESSTW